METIQARWFTPGRDAYDLIVLHSMESAEMGDTAESCARYLHNHPGVDSRGKPSKPSVQVCADTNSRVRCVADEDTANGAAGVNRRALHIEQAGRAAQSREEWLDDYGQGLLDQVAAQVAEWVTLHAIPLVVLDAQAIRAGARGITTHAEVSAAYHQSDHWDPGPGYPIDELMRRVRDLVSPAVHVPQEDDMPVTYCRDERYQNVFVEPFGGTVSAMPAGDVEVFRHDQRLASCVWRTWGCDIDSALHRGLLVAV